jgi:hypothetical protein
LSFKTTFQWLKTKGLLIKTIETLITGGQDRWRGAEWADAECCRTRVGSGEYEGLTGIINSARADNAGRVAGLYIGGAVIRALEDNLIETTNIRFGDYLSKLNSEMREEYRTDMLLKKIDRVYRGEFRKPTISDKIGAARRAMEYALASILWTTSVKALATAGKVVDFYFDCHSRS